MCGLAGIVGSRESPIRLTEQLTEMQRRLRHRGPDDEGIMLFPESGVGLVHTRLAILDTSAAGHQPMTSPCGRYTIVFNGEIYNFRDLAKGLSQEGPPLRSQSDTEVVLRMYAEIGPQCVTQFKGMFAIAIWDRREQSCFLARDPLGIKPLYVWESRGALAFASEVRALLPAALSEIAISEHDLVDHLLYGSAQEPGTIVRDIQSLRAGHSMIWQQGRSRVSQYWHLRFGAEILTDEDAVRVTRQELDDTMRRHLVSDVPVGVFLSGGIDSASIVALAQVQGCRDLETFCISFDEAEFNEGDLAARAAKHFGTKHHDWRLGAEEAEGLMESYLAALDRPSSDGFNTYCVSQFARRHGLKVVLSGLGGDELFGGYPSFRRIPQLMDLHQLMRYTGPVRAWVTSLLAMRKSSILAKRLAAFARSNGKAEAAFWATRGFFTPEEVCLLVAHYTGQSLGSAVQSVLNRVIPSLPSAADEVSYLEIVRYMKNQLLRDSDVMSMAHGLELRVPFADHTLYDRVGRIAAATRHRAGKRLLLDAVPEVPDWIGAQPKRGFRFPFDRWVDRHWGNQFREMQASIPVPLGAWYRKWSLYALEHFLNVNRVGVGAAPEVIRTVAAG